MKVASRLKMGTDVAVICFSIFCCIIVYIFLRFLNNRTHHKNNKESIHHRETTTSSKKSVNKGVIKKEQADPCTLPSSVTACKDVGVCTVMLFGNSSAVHLGQENMLLGHKPRYVNRSTSVITPSSRKLFEHKISLINLLGLCDAELNLSTVSHVVDRIECWKEIHALLYIIKKPELTDKDMLGLDLLQRILGDGILRFVILLFTYEENEGSDTSIDDMKKNPVLNQLVEKCGGRYHTCKKNMNNQSEMRALLEKIDQLVCENSHSGYTKEMYIAERKKKENPDNTEPFDKRRTSGSEQVTHPHTCIPAFLRGRTSDRKQVNKLKENHTKGNTSQTHSTEDIENLFKRLKVDRNYKLATAECLEIKMSSIQCHEPQTENELVPAFLERILMMNYKAKCISIKKESRRPSETESQLQSQFAKNKKVDLQAFMAKGPTRKPEVNHQSHIHPMDVQMTAFHHADHFLQQYMVTKLSQCQCAVPLLVPHPFTKEIEFPLWTLHQIKKSWMSVDSQGKITSKTMLMYQAETPMVAFFRIGSVSSSKSQLMNNLINEKHNTFFHRHCPGNSQTRLLMDGVVEIAWYCPSGKNTDRFSDCISFCNLHGDAKDMETQRKILCEMASVIVVVVESFEESNSETIEELFQSSKPLICILTEVGSSMSGHERKYKMGLKGRSQSDVLEELTDALKACLSDGNFLFKIEALVKKEGIKVDEDRDECQKGKTAAFQIMDLLENMELSKIKETYLPCQGKLLYELSQNIKDLHRLQTENLEYGKSGIRNQIEIKRKQQAACDFSELMRVFVGNLDSLLGKEKMYFLKWLGVLLDGKTSDELSKLRQQYDEKWAKAQSLKKVHEKSDQVNNEHTELERILEKINVTSFGLEHIFREMGQIYEAHMSVPQEIRGSMDLSHLPEEAAELMISGYPVELMDGDAVHVPLIWISAILDELTKKLGDPNVFVLSVLGIQSTGKSTLLNAMFGLQFAVSAGRCTRGAFMQLIKVSEEMKTKLKFDYILVVDTEGLRAQELTGKTRNHDNELATFVVGLGNMTLINVYGENLAEMQDILQIVVQAFMRMKKVRLSPSCMLVHQNVGDITAREINMEGRRRLHKQLDEMTMLAAKEEIYDAECFNDVIEFDVQEDVRYFAQLWEGSPPMAPPNPCYSEHVQELKKIILTKASRFSGINLTSLKSRIHDLWEALLNENFVFSFKNTLEIAVYRKLESYYSQWAWTLRSAMLDIENKWQNKIENDVLYEVDEQSLELELRHNFTEVQRSMSQLFEKDKYKDVLIQWRASFEIKIEELQKNIVRGTKKKLENVSTLRNVQKRIDSQRTHHENTLFEKSKELAIKLKTKYLGNEDLEKEFNSVWEHWVLEITKDSTTVTDINMSRDVIQVLGENFEEALVEKQRESRGYKLIFSLVDYSVYTVSKKHDLRRLQGLPQELYNYLTRKNVFHEEIKTLVDEIRMQTDEMAQSNPIARLGYNSTYLTELVNFINTRVNQHEGKKTKYTFKNEFTVDLSLCVCENAVHKFTDLHRLFREANDPVLYLEKKKPEYYNIFKKHFHGATSTAIFGEIICQKLKEPIKCSVYKKTAIDLANKIISSCQSLNGNRCNLEKHILKYLAEEENFEMFMAYIHHPQYIFKLFIAEEVNKYLNNNDAAIFIMKNNIELTKESLIASIHQATQMAIKDNQCPKPSEVTEADKETNSGANLWVKHFAECHSGLLKFTQQDLAGLKYDDITDIELLEKMVEMEIGNVISDIIKITSKESVVKDVLLYAESPEHTLYKHHCNCCWEKCPFCGATCTNTTEGHAGDHNVPFHRSIGVNGCSYRGKNEFSIDFCTTAVSKEGRFYPSYDSKNCIPWKEYRKGGPEFANWSITPDFSELAYWKWFVCHFQSQLEMYYEKSFHGVSEIPEQWRKYTKQDAISSLENYM